MQNKTQECIDFMIHARLGIGLPSLVFQVARGCRKQGRTQTHLRRKDRCAADLAAPQLVWM
ncbi:MAG TPA: hypothetical protein VFQ61_33795 [Polyangiaceae bacterium]|nr:hypothetical protein [Polyangiaceae bacterium]